MVRSRRLPAKVGVWAIIITPAFLAGCARPKPAAPQAAAVSPTPVAGGAPVAVVPAPPPEAMLYLLNGAADAPSLDLYMGNDLISRGLAFGGLVGPIRVAPGVQSFDLFTHGGQAARPATTPLATVRTGDLLAAGRYLGVIGGNLAPRGSQQPIQLIAYPAMFVPGEGPLLRLVNALAGAPPLQAGVVQNGSFLAPVTIGSVAFAGASQEAGSAFPAGPVQLGLAPVGAVSPTATFVVTATPGMRAFVVPIGAMSPASGEMPIRLAVVDTGATPWTVLVLEPQ